LVISIAYFEVFHPVHFHILDILLLRCTKCTLSHYISTPCSS